VYAERGYQLSHIDAISAMTKTCVKTPPATSARAAIAPAVPPLMRGGKVLLLMLEITSSFQINLTYARAPSHVSTIVPLVNSSLSIIGVVHTKCAAKTQNGYETKVSLRSVSRAGGLVKRYSHEAAAVSQNAPEFLHLHFWS
jgi:hypothetical protein